MSLVIVDTGVANLASVQFAFERLGATPIISDNADAISSAERVLIPGVGAAPFAMRKRKRPGLPQRHWPQSREQNRHSHWP